MERYSIILPHPCIHSILLETVVADFWRGTDSITFIIAQHDALAMIINNNNGSNWLD